MRFVSIFVFIAILLAWEFIPGRADTYASPLPPPSQIAQYLWHATADGSLPAATLVTLKRLATGYALGLVLGVPLGMLTARSALANQTLGVIALGLQTLPSVCWVPLSLLWFGQTESAMLFIVVMGTIWAVIIATDHGIRQIPPIFHEAAATMGVTGLRLWRRVLLPAALPGIIGGMKQGWAFAWRSLMAAEIYVTILSGFGLGHLLHAGRELMSTEQVAGIMLVIVVIGFAADKICFSPWERILRRRWGLS